MRPPDMPEKAPRDSSRQAPGFAHFRILGLIAVGSSALIGVVSMNSHQSANAPRAVLAATPPPESLSPAELLEIARGNLRLLVHSCAEGCDYETAKRLSGICGQRPLTAARLDSVASSLPPDQAARLRSIAEILSAHPELAPEILTMIHEFLGELPVTDLRKYIAAVIPSKDASLEDADMIENVASEFLKLRAESAVAPQDSSEPAGQQIAGIGTLDE